MAEYLKPESGENVQVMGEILLDSPIFFFLSKNASGKKMPQILAAIREVQNQLEAEASTSVKAISHEYSDESYTVLVVFEAKR